MRAGCRMPPIVLLRSWLLLKLLLSLLQVDLGRTVRLVPLSWGPLRLIITIEWCGRKWIKRRRVGAMGVM